MLVDASGFVLKILRGDALRVLPALAEASVDAVITSPPYAMQRGHYSGVQEADYPNWCVTWMRAVRRALKPRGSALIVIRPHVVDGQISDYVLRTRLALRDDGWREVDELIWCKPSAPPVGRVDRPRRSWESILWFSMAKDPFCDPKAAGTASSRLGISGRKGFGDTLHQSSGGEYVDGIARTRDIVVVSTSSNDRDPENHHPAAYPVELVEWMIRTFVPLGGTVLDPFVGSGSTAVAARNCGRHFVGCDIDPDYVAIAKARVRALPAVAKTKEVEAPEPDMIVGDCREVLPDLIDKGRKFDCIVTDPPYGIGMYGLCWDDEIAFDPELWRLLHHAVKPGAYVAALSSPRTYHKVATAVEAAGWIISPPMQWHHPVGMPQPKSVSEQMDRDNLKERRILGLRRFSGLAANTKRKGITGSVYRIAYEREVSLEARRWSGWHYGTNVIRPTLEPILIAQRPSDPGRMIDNIRRHGTGAVNIDAIRRDGWPEPILSHHRLAGTSVHPTQKPVALMEDLVRLLCPPGGHILDPFAGSGTTGEAARRHGFRATLIEKDPNFGLKVQQAAE